LISGLLYPLCTPRALWPVESPPVRSEEPAAVLTATCEMSGGEAAKPADAPTNVVPLRRGPPDDSELPLNCQPLLAPGGGL
jgi:hypothetical protein